MRLQALKVVLEEQSDVHQASQLVKTISADFGFDEYQSCMISLACSEICMNAVNHGLGGTMLISSTDNAKGIQLTIEDSGPGIANLAAAMGDGYSTYGSLGLGLGAATRSVDEVIFNKHDASGTSITIKHFLHIPRSDIATSVISRPVNLEYQNGDCTVIKEYDGECVLSAVIDGSGKGKSAAITSNFIADIVKSNYRDPLDKLIINCHEKVKLADFNRMAEMCLLRVTPNSIEYAGVGNISAHCSEVDINLPIQNGTIGLTIPKVINIIKYARPQSFLITLNSDGIADNVNLDTIDYQDATPYAIARVIYDNYCSGSDDSTVLVIKGMQ